MDNIIKSILESYKVFGRQKEKLDSKTQVIKELNMVKLNNTSYSNLKFDSDGTQNDSVNKALLDDIDRAARAAGLVATITTAKTGHNKLTKGSNNVSRHMNGTGVDIAILDGIGSGGATNGSNGIEKFRNLGFKLKDALVSMGYKWNIERGNDKAVLWQTNTGGNHFNHLHVSNRIGDTGPEPTDIGDEGINYTVPTYDEVDFKTNFQNRPDSEENKHEDEDEIPDIYGKFVDSLVKKMGLQEEKVFGEFGKKISNTFGSITIPKEDNKSIYSPVDGIINNIKVNTSCKNQITIEHEIDDKIFYLQFCGVSDKIVRDGETVDKGSLLGRTSEDVVVTLYNKTWEKQYISQYLKKEKSISKKSKGSTKSNKDLDGVKFKGMDKDVYKKKERYKDPAVAMLIDLVTYPFSDKYDEEGKLVQKRWAYPTDKVQPDPFIKDFYQKYNPVAKKKITENIEKIKRLIK